MSAMSQIRCDTSVRHFDQQGTRPPRACFFRRCITLRWNDSGPGALHFQMPAACNHRTSLRRAAWRRSGAGSSTAQSCLISRLSSRCEEAGCNRGHVEPSVGLKTAARAGSKRNDRKAQSRSSMTTLRPGVGGWFAHSVLANRASPITST